MLHAKTGGNKMKAVMLMFDSLNRNMLEPYGCDFIKTPNFSRLAKKTVTFDTCYAGSLPCMPARRELHTGRYNFLHKCWGPLEPFDDSMPEILKESGVYTHLVSDHLHYWEDGGGTYHPRYNTWEVFRGQEGDSWKGEVADPEPIDTVSSFTGFRAKHYRQDRINRKYMAEENDHPLTKTVAAGIEFIRTNNDADKWFLQIECFDPHEPFFSYEKYKDLYPHAYSGPQFDWADYRPVTETPDEVRHLRYEYAALLSMCDEYLGKVLDAFDEFDLWKDTMLIVNTDHGYLLGEHGYWAKNYMPQYNEIANIPLFIWDPRSKAKGERRKSLVQTIDLPVTLLEYFCLPSTKDMQGKSLRQVIEKDAPVREAGLFGVHGSHICCTDGRYVYMKATLNKENKPLYNYTLIPIGFFMFSPNVIKTMEIASTFPFTKDCPINRFEVFTEPGEGSYQYGDLLFDNEMDPKQENPIFDEAIIKEMKRKMVRLMEENHCPPEQFIRVGLDATY
jgi:arylsulfatase A-like enzyme